MNFIRLFGGDWRGREERKVRNRKKEKHVAASSIQTQRALLYGIDKTVLWFMAEFFCTPTSYLKGA